MDTGYDLNQRGSMSDSVRERDKVITVERNLFKNFNTKNTGTSLPQYKLQYSNNLYHNVSVGGYWSQYTPLWIHNSFIIPGSIKNEVGSNSSKKFNYSKIFHIMKMNSPTETYEWHKPFGHRTPFFNNAVLNGNRKSGLAHLSPRINPRLWGAIYVQW